MKHTAYNSEEVVDWHSAFLEDNPEGTLGKVTIPTQLASIHFGLGWDLKD